MPENRDMPFIQAIWSVLDDAERVLVCGHVRADGDCIGSMAAAARELETAGREVRLFFRGPVQRSLLELLPDGAGPSEEFPTDFEADVTLCLDAASEERVHPDFPGNAQGMILNIDHHRDNTRYGAVNWVDRASAATAEMLVRLFEARDEVPWSPGAAQALYLGIASDTGGFRFGNTTPAVLRAAARLVERGASPASAAETVWGRRPMESVRILSAVLGAMRFELDGRLGWSEIRRATYDACGGEENEPDNLTNEIRLVQGVEVAALIRETAEGTARASLRSSGRADVSAIAAQLHGGGHPAAAGLHAKGMPYEEGRERILQLVRAGVRAQLD